MDNSLIQAIESRIKEKKDELERLCTERYFLGDTNHPEYGDMGKQISFVHGEIESLKWVLSEGKS